jgi:hypothetical protein
MSAPRSARVLAAALVLLAGGAATADAGAWPRERGEAFLSFGQQASTGATTLLGAVADIRSWSSVYAEYGLSERLTVGLDAGLGQGQDQRVEAVLAFARLPVWSPGAHRVAADLGVGTIAITDEERQTRLRLGLAWGRGIGEGTRRWTRAGGWLGIDASAELRQPAGEVALKADFTAGLKPGERWMMIAQVQTGHYPDTGGIVRLAPSVVRRISEQSQLQLGMTAELVGEPALGMSGAIWFSF